MTTSRIQVAARSMATAKSGIGSRSQATAAAARRIAMRQPVALRPSGGATFQRTSGIAATIAAEMRRRRMETPRVSRSIVIGRTPGAGSGAPMNSRERRSRSSASAAATVRPTSGRSRTSCSNRRRGRRQRIASVAAREDAVRRESSIPSSPKCAGALTRLSDSSPSGPRTLISTSPSARRYSASPAAPSSATTAPAG